MSSTHVSPMKTVMTIAVECLCSMHSNVWFGSVSANAASRHVWHTHPGHFGRTVDIVSG